MMMTMMMIVVVVLLTPLTEVSWWYKPGSVSICVIRVSVGAVVMVFLPLRMIMKSLLSLAGRGVHVRRLQEEEEEEEEEGKWGRIHTLYIEEVREVGRG